MDFPLGTTPYDPISGVLEFTGTGVTCGSGDDFVDSPPELPCDIVDMEFYAIAKVAAKEGTRYVPSNTSQTGQMTAHQLTGKRV